VNVAMSLLLHIFVFEWCPMMEAIRSPKEYMPSYAGTIIILATSQSPRLCRPHAVGFSYATS
jgi:hypothetical protein